MKLNSKYLGLIILAFIFGGISVSAALGYWNTEAAGDGRGKTTQGVEQEAIASGDAESLIRGRTTFQELLDLGLSQEVVEEIIGGPIPDLQMRVKDYCTDNGLSFESIKSALQDRLGD